MDVVFLSLLEIDGSCEPDLNVLFPIDGRGPSNDDVAAVAFVALAVVTGFDIAREAPLFSFLEESGLADMPCSCLILNLRRLTRSWICSVLILLATKYRGCLFRKYSRTSSVLVSAFNCLSFILWW